MGKLRFARDACGFASLLFTVTYVVTFILVSVDVIANWYAAISLLCLFSGFFSYVLWYKLDKKVRNQSALSRMGQTNNATRAGYQRAIATYDSLDIDDGYGDIEVPSRRFP